MVKPFEHATTRFQLLASFHLFPSFSLLLAFFFCPSLAFLLYICRTIFCFIVPGKLHLSFSVVKRYIEVTLAQSVSKSDFTHSRNLRIYQPKMKYNLSSEIYNTIAVKNRSDMFPERFSSSSIHPSLAFTAPRHVFS